MVGGVCTDIAHMLVMTWRLKDGQEQNADPAGNKIESSLPWPG